MIRQSLKRIFSLVRASSDVDLLSKRSNLEAKNRTWKLCMFRESVIPRCGWISNWSFSHQRRRKNFKKVSPSRLPFFLLGKHKFRFDNALVWARCRKLFAEDYLHSSRRKKKAKREVLPNLEVKFLIIISNYFPFGIYSRQSSYACFFGTAFQQKRRQEVACGNLPLLSLPTP